MSRSTKVPALDDPRLYINRELGLLEFQRRVLEEAQDERNPLLERAKFLAIFGSNLDEFFMVRVSGIRRQVLSRIAATTPAGMTPREELAAIRRFSIELYATAQGFLRRKLLPQLGREGVHILDYARLNATQRARADSYFREMIHPVLTPLAVDPGHPFPHISNLSLNLAIVVRDPKGNERFARLKVPDTLPRLVPLRRSSGGERRDGTLPRHHYFVWIEQVIEANLAPLFPGMEVVSAHPFRVVRDADIEIQEIEADDLLETMQQGIRRRKFGSVVQVAIYENMPASVRELLLENLEARTSDLFVMQSPLGLSALWQVYNAVERHELKFPPYRPFIPKPLRKLAQPADVFDAIRAGNILVHHPYDSFEPVVEFLRAAARDPQVLAIKQTLYRVGSNSPVVSALLEAAENGKQVAVLVELSARFDEASNIGWARMLEQVGVHVVYGVVGLKTHSKIAMVVRREGEGIRRYLHLATGNYNPVTAGMYEDIGIFTCDETMGVDATDLFNYLTGYSTKQDYQKLLIAPVTLRARLEELIEREITHAVAGRRAHIVLKANSLVDPRVIRQLYRASQAGVRVELFIRGICCLRPGWPGVSDNITVVSTVGRYLEHSRIFYFLNDGAEEVYLGSADLMQRNLSHRVEVVFPVESPEHRRYLCDHALASYRQDNFKARRMRTDGTYERVVAGEGVELRGAQDILMRGRGRLQHLGTPLAPDGGESTRS
ncbi:MAG: polyphosphate kinase 1 [bacterium]|nr:polyphosphate kinase 1 [bacterium]